ncbi:unnamed protein product [Boreogadus saida]
MLILYLLTTCCWTIYNIKNMSTDFTLFSLSRPAHQVLTSSSFSQGMLPARQSTWKRVFVGTRLSLKTLQTHFKSEEDCDAFGDRSTQRGATSEILGVVAPGSSHWSSHSEELVQTPDTISIKVEEDIGGGLPAVDHFALVFVECP